MDTFAVRLFFRAFQLAHEANAFEITRAHLLNALESTDSTKLTIPAQTEGRFLPVPHHDLALAQDAARIFMESGGLEDMTEESLRAALKTSE